MQACSLLCVCLSRACLRRCRIPVNHYPAHRQSLSNEHERNARQTPSGIRYRPLPLRLNGAVICCPQKPHERVLVGGKSHGEVRSKPHTFGIIQFLFAEEMRAFELHLREIEMGFLRRRRGHPPVRSRGITVAVTSWNTASSRGAALQVCGQYRTNSSMPISLKRPTMSSKYSTDCQGVSGGKQTRECSSWETASDGYGLSRASHRA